LRVALLGFVALSVTACSSTTTPVADRVPISEQVLDVAAELAALRSQMDGAIAECLRAEGFPYFAKSTRHHFEALLDLFSLRVLTLSIESARADGYGSGGGSTLTTDEEYEYFNGLTDVESDAYALAHIGAEEDLVEHTTTSGARVGIPVGGCSATGASMVYGSTETYVEAEGIFYDLQFMLGEVLTRVEADEQVRSASADWSSCMTEAGYSFQAPADARDAALVTRAEISGEELGRATPEERAIASADAGCQDEVSLNEIYTNAAVQEQRSVTSDRDRLFLAWAELMQRVAAEGYADLEADSQELLPRTQGAGGRP
jgi:hypothetical protein